MKLEFDYQCDRDWNDMKGGDRRRFCDSCEKHVHHISHMTKEEARKFLEERNYDVCVDFYQDADGDTIFAERQSKLASQAEGLKQLIASAIAIVPLAIAAAFIDLDGTADAPVPVMMTSTPTPEPRPIQLDGPTPIVVNTTFNGALRPIESRPAPDPVVEEPPPIVEPVVVDLPEPDPQPAVLPIQHVRGKIAMRRDRDWAN